MQGFFMITYMPKRFSLKHVLFFCYLTHSQYILQFLVLKGFYSRAYDLVKALIHKLYTRSLFFLHLQGWSNPRRRWRRRPSSWLWDLWNNVQCPLTYLVHWKNFHRRSSRRDLAAALAALARHPSVYASVYASVHARAMGPFNRK